MSIKAIVVDDEPLARARMRRLLTAKGLNVVAEGENGQQALDLVAQHSVDMLFIDINMPVKSGLAAAAEISDTIEHPPAIVFCTAYDEFAIEAFKSNAISYLLKPIQADELDKAIGKASAVSRLQFNHLLQQNRGIASLAVHHQGALQNIELNQFSYFCSIDKNVFAVLLSGEQILVDKTLKFLEAEYPDDLIRVHRSHLANRHHLQQLVKSEDGQVEVVLKHSGAALVVSRRHLSQVKKCFN